MSKFLCALLVAVAVMFTGIAFWTHEPAFFFVAFVAVALSAVAFFVGLFD